MATKPKTSLLSATDGTAPVKKKQNRPRSQNRRVRAARYKAAGTRELNKAKRILRHLRQTRKRTTRGVRMVRDGMAARKLVAMLNGTFLFPRDLRARAEYMIGAWPW